MNELDAIVIIFILFHCISGFRKGLVLATFNLMAMIGGIILSNMYYQKLSLWLTENTTWAMGLKKAIRHNLLGSIPDVTPSKDALLETLKEVPLPEGLKLKFIDSDLVQNTVTQNPEKIDGVFVDWIASILMNLVSLVLIFVGVIIVVKIVGLIIDQIVKIPVLKEINQVGGLLFGIVKGVLYVMVLILLLPPLSTVLPNLEIMEKLNQSQIAIYFYKYNMVYMIFRLLVKI